MIDLDDVLAHAHDNCAVCEGTGVVRCWSPGGPCPDGQTVCESCGPCRQSDVPALVAALREARDEVERLRGDALAVLHDADLTYSLVTETADGPVPGPMRTDADAIARALGIDRITGEVASASIADDPSATTDPQSASVSPEEALTVRCGTCDADPGEACVTVGPWPGRVQRYPHESRYGKAREARPSATTDGGAP